MLQRMHPRVDCPVNRFIRVKVRRDISPRVSRFLDHGQHFLSGETKIVDGIRR